MVGNMVGGENEIIGDDYLLNLIALLFDYGLENGGVENEQ